MSHTLFVNAAVLDAAQGELLADRSVRVKNGRIAEIADGKRPAAAGARVVDLRGRTLMPGLIDGHVHVTAATPDFAALARWSPSYVAARTGDILKGMIGRGFTTVRDAGGADFGIADAVAEGYLVGPRVIFGGKALSQTGGHADMRGRGESIFDPCPCCAGLGRICDGVAEVRRAAREEIRRGARHIKIMASGGIASPTDRIGNTQFSVDEIRAAVEEAEAAEIYVMAHAYTARAINRALDCGVRSIEHGNLLNEESVELFLKHKAFLVPTLIAYRAIADDGLAAGFPRDSHAKVYEVLDAGLKALELAHRRGVKIVYGTDLLGTMHVRQLDEFQLRAEVQTPAEVIRSATETAAELLGMAGEIGRIAVGARADLLVVDGDPLRKLAVMARPEKHLKAILKDGRWVKDELG